MFTIVPVTNPVATAIFNTLISLKARCAVILSFHHACVGVGNAVCEIMEKVLAQHQAPVGLVRWCWRTSRAKTAKFTSHHGVSSDPGDGQRWHRERGVQLGNAGARSGPRQRPVLCCRRC